VKTILQNRWLLFSLRLILGVIFVVASISKIQDIAKFVSIVSSYGMLPNSLANLYGNIVPWVELFIGCALLLGVFIRFSAALLVLLIISFMAASSYALANAVGGACGCFGKFLTLSHPVALTIDILMLFISLILLFSRGKEFLSIGQMVERFHIKSKLLGAGSRIVLVGLVMVIAAFGSIGIHNLVKQPELPLETINIPAPLATDVDAALLQHKPVLMEFYIDGCHLCQAAAPVIYDMETEFTNKIVLMRLDYNQYYQNSEVVTDLNITNIPAVLVIESKNSEGKYNISGRFEGSIPKEALQSYLEKAINSQ
jgi:uncharacterized membrane protein YphA (DoxX/SURF4 family)/thiol-disulfide isomerase/thioredoxin